MLRFLTERSKGIILGVRSKYRQLFTPEKRSDFEYYEKIYKSVPIVHSAINATADHAAGIGFQVKTENPRVKEIIDEFLKQQDMNLFLHTVTRHVLVYGNAFVEIVKNTNMIEELRILHPKTMTILQNEEDGTISGYRQKLTFSDINKTEEIDFGLDEIAHFKWNVIGDEPYGTSVIESLKSIINLKLEIEKDLRKISHRYVAPILHYKINATSQDALDSFRDEIENMHPEMDIITSKNDEVTVLNPLSRGIGIDSFLEHIENQLVAGVQVPEVILGRGKNATEATAQIQLQAFDRRIRALQRTLKQVIEQKILKQLMEMNGIDEIPEWEWGELVKEDEDVKVNRLLRLKAAGILSARAVARMLGYSESDMPEESELQAPAKFPQDKGKGTGNTALKGLDDTKKDVTPHKRPMK